MKIAIEGLDYTCALDVAHAVTIERKLNERSQCVVWLTLLSRGELGVPSRDQTVAVTDDDGTTLFTGTIVASPIAELVGLRIQGPKYRYEIVAQSDEVLLDQYSMPRTTGIAGETAESLIRALTVQTGYSTLVTTGLADGTKVSNFAAGAGASWSESVRRIADIARCAYRIVNKTLTLLSVESVTHLLDESQGNVNPANLTLEAGLDRMPVNDVTLCGESEPVAYATEYFLGDGVTANFYLTTVPYFGPESDGSIIREQFSEPEIDTRIWSCTGNSGYFGISAGGLSMRGGNGADGETALSWLNPIEMGGTLLLETIGLTLEAGSSGIISGFFNGGAEISSCTAGFQAGSQQSSSHVILQPIVQGVAAGTAFTANPQNQYTLRLRVHSSECHRSTAIYR